MGEHLDMPPATLPTGMRQSEISFRDLVDRSLDMVVVTDDLLDLPGPHIRYVNPAFTWLTGWSAEEVIGLSPRILQGPGTDMRVTAEIGAALRSGTGASAKVLNYTRTRVPYWVDMRIVPLLDDRGKIRGFGSFGRDVTFDKRRLDELEQLVDRDVLTGLPNRRALLRTAAGAFATHDPGKFCFAWLELDQLWRVTERCGEAVTDAVLLGVADRLTERVRRADLIGRMGMEEFAICMPGLGAREGAAVGERLRAAVADAPFLTAAGPISIACSLGLAVVRAGDTFETLMNRSVATLYEMRHAAKSATSSTY